MTSNDLDSPVPISSAGTLDDYTDDSYRDFFEVSARRGTAKGVFLKHLGTEHSARLRQVEKGYEVNIPVQCAPERVQLLTNDNVAVYQLVRL